MLPVNKAEEFALAIRRKLVLEVAGRSPAAEIVPIAAEEPIDCLAGEKLRERLAPYYPGLDN
jgi:hypothetical protein